LTNLQHFDGVDMAELFNLRRFKKHREREQSELQAEANRVQFGRTKSERAAVAMRNNQASNLLDQHRMNSEDAS
jgi:hypothetical protein